MTVHDLDDIDRDILRWLHTDGRMSLTALARRVHLTRPAVRERVRRMEDRGVITGFTITVDHAALGFPVRSIVQVAVDGHNGTRLPEILARHSEIIECSHVTGDDCFLATVVARDLGHLEEVVGGLGAVGPTRTLLVFSSPVSNGWPLPLGDGTRDDARER